MPEQRRGDEPEKNLDYYRAYLTTIQDEMNEHGISSIVILHEADPIGKRSAVNVNQRGESVLLRGMLDQAYHSR